VSLSAHKRWELLSLARRSIEAGLRDGRRAPYPGPVPPSDAGLRGSFVTLRVDQELRGCCGTINPERHLAEDVWRNAWASAFSDPRFAALTAAEYPRSDLHICVLSPLETLTVAGEAELLKRLRPQMDGLVLELGGSRATFLPAVWEQLQRPADFLRQLKLKAGWSADFWSPQLRVFRYTAEEFGEEG
jgi:AmmeMemoRadiSam system protein A